MQSSTGVAVAGSLVGSLLLVLPATVFDVVVPALVALASVLLEVQPWLARSIGEPAPDAPDRRAVLLPQCSSPRSTEATSAGRSASS